jgi:hypothetical protein
VPHRGVANVDLEGVSAGAEKTESYPGVAGSQTGRPGLQFFSQRTNLVLEVASDDMGQGCAKVEKTIFTRVPLEKSP